MSFRTAVLVIVSSVLVACGSGNKAPQQPEKATPVQKEAPDADAKVEAPADPEPAPLTKEELVAKAIERAGSIQTEVAAIRGREFKSKVPAEYQTEEDFAEFVRTEMEKELPDEKNKELSAAAYHLGLMDKPIDLKATIEHAFVTQAAGYYDPTQKKFFIVVLSSDDSMLDTITSHELMHGLQDQYFDLNAYYHVDQPDNPLTEDQANARRFIVEGEATMLMIVYVTKAYSGMDMLSDDGVKQLGTVLKFQAMVDASTMAQQQGAMFEDEDMKKQMDAMKDIPLYILVPLFESYTKGALPVFEAYAAGGWGAVDALYTNPPDSTEQVLHPAEKLVGARDYPIALTLPTHRSLKKWTSVHSDVMGELGWRVYLTTWLTTSHDKIDVDAAAAGWDGDRYAVYAKDGSNVGVLATTWDTEDDAKEFEQAYIATLAARFDGAKSTTKRGVTTTARPDGTQVLVERRKKDVYIVDGADAKIAAKLLKDLRKTKQTKHADDK
jgi:hypothetical protein